MSYRQCNNGAKHMPRRAANERQCSRCADAHDAEGVAIKPTLDCGLPQPKTSMTNPAVLLYAMRSLGCQQNRE